VETTILLAIAVLGGFYMAWNIGANDVANAFGTSVGSGALTLRHAILCAAIFEFSGAFLVGEPVARTISGGIVKAQYFAGAPDLIRLLGVGMLASLIASAIWMHIASFLGQPVSTTHAIVGAVIGFALACGGPAYVRWGKIGAIACSWVVSPVVGGVLAYTVYRWGIQQLILRSRHPVFMAIATVPVAMGSLVAIVAMSIVYKGLPRLHLNLPLGRAIALSALAGAAVFVATRLGLRRRMRRHGVPRARRYQVVERWFGRMQIATACYMSFAHGANDVANAIGPLASSMEILRSGKIPGAVTVPPWLLAFGGAGIVAGLAMYGYKVIDAVGKKITEITPTRGFAATFGTATSVLVFSKLGMPISTTFVIVGAVMGVGFARGFGAIDMKVIRKIFASWLVTIPICAALSAAVLWVFRAALGL